MNTTQNLTAAADELNDEQLTEANGGIFPILVYVGAVAVGAAIGAGISIVQGFADAHAAQSK